MDGFTVREHTDVCRWKLQDVSDWLTKQNLGDFAQRFEGKQNAPSSLFVLVGGVGFVSRFQFPS